MSLPLCTSTRAVPQPAALAMEVASASQDGHTESVPDCHGYARHMPACQQMTPCISAARVDEIICL
eukprot:3095356-Pleurochrysis_carterae.AAC.3